MANKFRTYTVSELRRIAYNTFKKIMKMKNYDQWKFIIELQRWVDEIDYFYSKRVKYGQDPTEVQYELPKDLVVSEGSIVYINLRRGYPKELNDGHWCYVLKKLGNVMVVIPTTSIKDDSKPINEAFEIEIKIKDFEEEGNSRLRINHIRSVDYMRMHTKRKIYEVETNVVEINKKVQAVLLTNVDK